jgi:hypothetical protein
MLEVEYLTDDQDMPYIRVLSDPWVGVCVKTGAISFPDENEPVMQFEYDIIEGVVEDKQVFEQRLGDFIVSVIEEQLKTKSLLYTGGTEDKT